VAGQTRAGGDTVPGRTWIGSSLVFSWFISLAIGSVN
jgi:hypothetical protein